VLVKTTARRIGVHTGQVLDIDTHQLGEQYCGPECTYLTRAYRSTGIGWDCRVFKTELTLVQLPEESPFSDEPVRCVERCKQCRSQEMPERVPERIENHDDLHQVFRRLDQLWDVLPGHPDWAERKRLLDMLGEPMNLEETEEDGADGHG
jgi:hypothetical protein